MYKRSSRLRCCLFNVTSATVVRDTLHRWQNDRFFRNFYFSFFFFLLSPFSSVIFRAFPDPASPRSPRESLFRVALSEIRGRSRERSREFRFTASTMIANEEHLERVVVQRSCSRSPNVMQLTLAMDKYARV